jgi:hypothetical protein
MPKDFTIAYTASVTQTTATVIVTNLGTTFPLQTNLPFVFQVNVPSQLIIMDFTVDPTWSLETPYTFSVVGKYNEYDGSYVSSINVGATFDTSVTNPDNTGFNTTIGGTVTADPVVCFVAESMLLTPKGYMAAKDIQPGDSLVTADGRKVPVKVFRFIVENTDKDTAPFLIHKNAFGPSSPKNELRLSPWHAFQIRPNVWMKAMSAFQLNPKSVQQYDIGKDVTYYHFEAPNFFKDNFICDGTVVESFGGSQTFDMTTRVYTYNKNLGGYTRVASKPTKAKALLM